MGKKKVLVLDRGYVYKYMKSDVFDVIVVCLQKDEKKRHEKEGLTVVGCFEDEYDELPIASVPENYLIHSFDSDRFLGRYDWNKRQEILGKEISFWQRIFDTYRPECIVNEVVTIEWMEVMAIEAQRRNIKYYRNALLPFDREDIWVDNNAFDSRLGASFWEEITPSAEDYDKAKLYINDIREKRRKPYFIKGRRKSKIERLVRSIKSFVKLAWLHFFKRGFYYEDYYYIVKWQINTIIRSILYNRYDSLDKKEDVELFFYPLHYEPEATLEYFSYHFNDQAMVIGRIAHTLRTNQKLIVKEHPQQEGVLMTKKYLDLKKKYPNLIYLKGNISSYDVYPHIKCLITLCGTAGFESWICKKSVIAFGNVYYSDMPGIVHCESFKQLYDVIRGGKYKTADDDTILEYVAKMYHVMVEVFPVMLGGELNQTECEIVTRQIEKFLR